MICVSPAACEVLIKARPGRGQLNYPLRSAQPCQLAHATTAQSDPKVVCRRRERGRPDAAALLGR